MIESYNFGKIKIDGIKYYSDLIIYPDNIDCKWWREKSHLLQKNDLSNVVNYKPEILIIGTGESGLMKVTEETKNYFESKGISLIIEKTEDACNTYNKLKDNKKIIAALHLTC